MPDPDEYKLDVEQLGSFERNANGRLVGDIIGVKRKINCVWKILEGKYYSELISVVSPFFIRVDYVNPDGIVESKDMYTTMQSGKLIMRKNGESFWGNVTCSFIER